MTAKNPEAGVITIPQSNLVNATRVKVRHYQIGVVPYLKHKLFMFFCLVLSILIYLFFVVTYTKTEIAQWYGISRPTLRKWVRYFSPQTDYETWKSKRKLSGWEVLTLQEELGCPDDANCLTKGQIKEQCETEYQTVTGMIELNATKIGISVSTYRSVDVFPPLFSKRIVSMME